MTRMCFALQVSAQAFMGGHCSPQCTGPRIKQFLDERGRMYNGPIAHNLVNQHVRSLQQYFDHRDFPGDRHYHTAKYLLSPSFRRPVPEVATRSTTQDAELNTSDIPAKIHLADLAKFPSIPMSYMGDGWYRPVLPVPSHNGSIRPPPCVIRTEVQEIGMGIDLQDPQAERAAETPPTPPPQEKRFALQSIDEEGVVMEDRKEVQQAESSSTGDIVHFTKLRDHPRLEFRSVGNGMYKKDASRTGEWVIVPHGMGSTKNQV
ncbi:hypothetical protein LTR85_009802 [Meristemomyces frigidus]|nr:hypothetical protein LTR85_009802 [Meristemomyces frigidus]